MQCGEGTQNPKAVTKSLVFAGISLEPFGDFAAASKSTASMLPRGLFAGFRRVRRGCCCPGSFVRVPLHLRLDTKPMFFRSSDRTSALLPILVRRARNLLAFRIDLPGFVSNCALVLFGFAFSRM
jgi:hypothetical protein